MYNKQTYLLFLILSIVQNKECEINHLDSFFYLYYYIDFYWWRW